MGTTAQRFYPSNADQDQAWGTDVDKLDDTSGVVVSTTRAMHPNSAGTTTITLDPYNDRSTTGDATTDFGWAFDEASTDGMQSGTHTHASSPSLTGVRRIAPGNWSFSQRITIPTAGAVTGSHNVTVAWKVYRVATGGGTRTLLFTATAAEVAGTLTGSVDRTVTASHDPGEVLLAAGETIHVGITSTNRQVAGALGATTAGTIVYHTGGAADAYVDVASPGVRSRYSPTLTTEALPAVDSLTRRLYMPRNLSETVQGTDLTTPVQRAVRTGRVLTESLSTVDSINRVYRSFRTLAESILIGSDTPARFFKGQRSPATESILTNETLDTAFKGSRTVSESYPTTDAPVARMFRGWRGPPTESIPTSDVTPNRVYKARRDRSESYPTTDPAPERKYNGQRTQAEFIATTDFITRAIKQRRFLEEFPTGVSPDYAVTFPTRKVAGVVRDQSGTPYEGADVRLFREFDDKMVQTTTSAADGTYEFLRDEFDPYTYYVTASETDGDPTQGLTVRGLVPESV